MCKPRPKPTESTRTSLWRSSLDSNGRFVTVEEVLTWHRRLVVDSKFTVEPIPFAEMDHWYFADNPHRLAHRSGRFFAVEGLRVQTTFGMVPCWDQPIINQPEIGILGILSKVFDGVRYFLMQGKIEPGNVNLVQLSPTVQATRSNYQRVHQGKQTLYLDYFTQPQRAARLIDQLQTEQGARFLRKRNRNMIIDVTEEVPVHDHFCWLTLGQIKRLLAYDNLVNMDARSVLSCIPVAAMTPLFDDEVSEDDARACYSMDEILSWITELKTAVELAVERIPLNQVRDWSETATEIRHDEGRHFSVIAVSVQAEHREVVSWTQPLLKHRGRGVIGFLSQTINGVRHVLVRASVEPGNFDTVDLGPTVVFSGSHDAVLSGDAARFLDLFINASPEQVRYSAVQSEEGGRFYHFQNRYMIVDLPPDAPFDVPEHFMWITLAQLQSLARHGYVNIEARSLLACLPLRENQAVCIR